MAVAQKLEQAERRIRSLGISGPELLILTSLFSLPNGRAPPRDLQSCTFQSAANLSRVGDLLVRKGFVTRGSYLRSRRRIELRITEAGEAEVRQLLPKTFAGARTLTESFSHEERLVLIKQLRRCWYILQFADCGVCGDVTPVLSSVSVPSLTPT